MAKRTHAETASLLNEVKYPGLSFELTWAEGFVYAGVPYPYAAQIRVVCKEGQCNITGKPHSWNGRWWRLSEHMTDSEIVWTAFKAVLTALEHEAREKFTFKGIRVADSHVDIHKLADFMAQPSVQDARS